MLKPSERRKYLEDESKCLPTKFSYLLHIWCAIIIFTMSAFCFHKVLQMQPTLFKSLYHCLIRLRPYQTLFGRPQTEQVAKDYSMHKYMKLKYVNNLSRSLLVRLQHEEVHKAARRKEPGSRASRSAGRRAQTGVMLH